MTDALLNDINENDITTILADDLHIVGTVTFKSSVMYKRQTRRRYYIRRPPGRRLHGSRHCDDHHEESHLSRRDSG